MSSMPTLLGVAYQNNCLGRLGVTVLWSVRYLKHLGEMEVTVTEIFPIYLNDRNVISVLGEVAATAPCRV